MSREIKFRAWYPKHKLLKILGFMISFYNNGEYGYSDASYGARCGDDTNVRYGHEYRDDDIILMQYTGLKDKNGVEIYEGDIIDFDYFGLGNNLIAFELGSFILANQTEVTGCLATIFEHTVTDGDYFVPCEVIGNIYENPELLSDKK